MNVINNHSENDTLHKCVVEISNIIDAISFAESDPSTGIYPAAVLKLCIKQLNENVRTLNNSYGANWPENQ